MRKHVEISFQRTIQISLLGTSLFFTCLGAVAADDPLLVRYAKQGWLELKAKNYPEAEKFFQAALMRALNFSHNDQLLSQSYDHLADLQYLQGNYVEAEPYYRKAIASLESYLPNKQYQSVMKETLKAKQELVHQMADLADCLRAEAKYPEVETIYRNALKIDVGASSKAVIEKASIESDLGDVLSLQGKYAEAEEQYKTALPVFEKAHNQALTLDLLQDYEALLLINNRIDEADAMENRIKTIRATADAEQPSPERRNARD